VRALAADGGGGAGARGAIDEAAIHARLYHPELPDPDLLIRTAGEQRISNFLLWQVSYAEIHVAEVCWPEFRAEHLQAAFRDYGRRVRKFGKVT
ncbi:MAG: undecaprenyl diphosphate synthase family protein, partial [Planctomycetota bacterium]